MKVLLYDCDGVLGDTEQYGHLVAFNQMWQEYGVPWSWSVEQYGLKLAIGGGKERMASLWDDADFRAAVSDLAATRDEYVEIVAGWHKRKSAIYKELILSGKIPPRPGVKRLAREALDAGWTLGVCSTSAKPSVEAVVGHVMGDLAERFSLLLAGDMVKIKKPAPDIYNMAAEQLGVSPADCLVIEDSRNGLRAAHAAGMKCLVTVSGYTRDEDFSEAALVVTCLGDPGGEQAEVLANRSAAQPGPTITAGDLEQILSG